MLGLFRKSYRIGLDLGLHSMKYAVLDNKGVVEYLANHEIIPNRKSKEQTLKSEEMINRIKDILKDCQKNSPGYGNTVSTAIQGEGTICKYLDLPQISQKELPLAVESLVRKFIAFPMDTINLSYVVVPTIDYNNEKIGIFFAAAQKKSVEDIKYILENCGLKIERLEPPVMAIVREFTKDHDYAKDQFFALIHIGFRLTQVIILRDKFPYYVREFSLGGRDFTYAFQMAEQISWKKAEQLKLDYSLETEYVGIQPFINRWIEDVKKSLDFFKKQFSKESSVQSAYLSGGGANMKGLDKILSLQLGIPVEVDQWDRIKQNKAFENELSSTYKVALGLAIKE